MSSVTRPHRYVLKCDLRWDGDTLFIKCVDKPSTQTLDISFQMERPESYKFFENFAARTTACEIDVAGIHWFGVDIYILSPIHSDYLPSKSFFDVSGRGSIKLIEIIGENTISTATTVSTSAF